MLLRFNGDSTFFLEFFRQRRSKRQVVILRYSRSLNSSVLLQVVNHFHYNAGLNFTGINIDCRFSTTPHLVKREPVEGEFSQSQFDFRGRVKMLSSRDFRDKLCGKCCRICLQLLLNFCSCCFHFHQPHRW